MKRWIAVSIALVFLAGCSGMGSGSNRFLPGASVSGTSGLDGLRAGPLGLRSDGRHRMVRVALRMRIPKRHRHERTPVHPATISPLTQSVGIAVNGGTASIFNTTPSSSNCSTGSSGLTCTFALGVPAGNDTFVVTTYSAASGGGTPLNQGTAVLPIVAGQANSVHITLGPVVSSTADSGIGSLRYAVGTANPGDTIMFTLPAGSTLTLSTPITLNTSVSITGPGVTSSIRMHHHRHGRVSHTSFSGLTISGGGAQQLFIVKPGVTATISGLILTDGLASVAHQPGGAISNQGTLTLAGDAVTGSTSTVTTIRVRPHERYHARHAQRPPKGDKHHPVVAHVPVPAVRLHPHACPTTDQYGGAVYNNGTLTLTGTTFDSNMVSSANGCSYGYGGAIYNDTNGSIISSGSTYSNNGAEYGGAIYNDGTYGQTSFTGDTFAGNYGCTDANGCTTSGCTVGSSCSSYAQGYGAAIYDASGPGAAIASSTFSSNVVGGNSSDSYGDGGALYLATGSPLITGSTFSGNLAGGGIDHCSQGYGGAVYEDASGTLELDNDTFTNNQAGGDLYGYGGAIYNNSNADHGSNNTFTGNVAFGSGSDCTGSNTAYSYGGAIYAYYGINMSGSAFSNNVATGEYFGEAGAVYEDNTSQLTNDTFTGNSAVGTDVADSDGYAYGGAIEADSTLKVSNSTFTGNSAQAIGSWGYECYGGAVYASGDFTSTNNTYSSNTSTATYPVDGYVYGVAIYASGSILSSSHDTFTANAATSTYEVDGGGIYADGPLLNANGDTFTNNSINAPYTYGGGVEVANSSSAITGSTFSGNVASTGSTYQGYGGAVYDDSGLTINGSTFSNNVATAAGGAVYGSGGDTVNTSTFTGNQVTNALPYYGGGAYYDSSGLSVSNSTFANNTSADAGLYTGGGAIYNDDALIVSGSTFQGNGTTGNFSPSGGGAIFNYDPIGVVNSTFTGNTSATNGGAIFNYDNNTNTLVNDTIFGNTATSLGGNIENQYPLTLMNTIVAGGIAASNPDIDNLAALSTGDYNLIGAGVDNSGSGTFTAGTHDQVGTHAAPISPVLSALSNNGGPTMTMADGASSPGKGAIPFASSNCGNAAGNNIDQRGFTRGAGGVCDIGAYEFGGTPSTIRLHHRAMRHGHHHHPSNHHHHGPMPVKIENHRHASSKGVTQ